MMVGPPSMTPFRIATIYAALFSLSLIVLLFAIYQNSALEVGEQLRDRISEEADRLAEIHKREGTDALVPVLDALIRDSRLNGLYFDLRGPDGSSKVGNLPNTKFVSGWGTVQIYEDPDDARDNDLSEVVIRGMQFDDGSRLIIGGSKERIDDLKEIIWNTSSWVLGVTILLALGGGLWISRITMKRVAVINATSRSIMAGDLSLRLPCNGSGDEIDHLSSSINTMLERIELLMGTMKQVTNDIAHDLRTPLGNLRQRLERARDASATPTHCQDEFDEAVNQVDDIIETFNALLRIGQIDAGHMQRRFKTVNLSDIATRIVDSYIPVSEDKCQCIDAGIEPSIHVQGDPELLSQMLVNLLENAINHCPPRTRIAVDLKLAGDRASLSVSDDGPGVPKDEMNEILRPFYRLEKSRTSDGSGLGLALVDAIARAHGFDMELSDNGPGLRVSFDMPRAA